MSYTIRAQQGHPGLDLLVQRFNTREEYQTVFKLCSNKKRINWLQSMLIPARTDTLAEFFTDFFLPRVFDEARKVQGIGLRIFIILGAIPWCVITFPIRCITAIPWYIYAKTHPKETHPFYQYLIKNGVSAADLSKDSIFLETREAERTNPNEDRYVVTTRGVPFYFRYLLDLEDEDWFYSSRIMSQKELEAYAKHILRDL